jgi:CBS-domain-containing membrane protein
MRVADVRHPPVARPAVITPDQSIRRLLQLILEDPRTHHAYVVDRDGRMIGTIRLDALVRFLFPHESVDTSEGTGEMLRVLSADCAGDIMQEDFRWVKDSTTLEELVKIMIEDRVDELPVVDEQMRPVGEIGMIDVITAWIEGDDD